MEKERVSKPEVIFMEYKKCSKCLEELPTYYFSPRPSRNSLTSACKPCLAKGKVLYRKANKEKVNSQQKVAYIKNREENIKRSQEYYKENKEAISLRKAAVPKEERSKQYRRWRHKLTEEQYQELLEKQKNLCAICGISGESTHKGVLCIDHNHTTNEVRGLLCDTCNRAIGMLKDDPTLLEKASLYLYKFNPKNYPFKRVVVYWWDAESSDGWSTVENTYESPLICSAGFLVGENDSTISIASTLGTDGVSNARIHIPKKMIERMEDF